MRMNENHTTQIGSNFKKEPFPLWITKRHNHFTLHCGIPTNFLSDDSSIFFFFFSVARKGEEAGYPEKVLKFSLEIP